MRQRSMFFKRIPGALMMMTCVLSPGCGKKDKTPAEKKTTAKKQGLVLTAKTAARWIPTSIKEAAYKVAGKPKIYTPKNLHKLLNGGADMYVEAGMVRLVYVLLEDGNKKAAQCQAYLYMMKDAAHAARLLKNETDKNWRPLAVGDKGVHDGQGAMFVKGRFYVRIDAPPKKEGVTGCPYKEVAARIVSTPDLPF